MGELQTPNKHLSANVQVRLMRGFNFKPNVSIVVFLFEIYDQILRVTSAKVTNLFDFKILFTIRTSIEYKFWG